MRPMSSSFLKKVREHAVLIDSKFYFSAREHGKKALVNLCLHNVTEYGNIDPSLIRFHVKQADCSGIISTF